MQPRVPSLVSGVDFYALPLSTIEGFVLSRVDGSASVEDIWMMAGMEKQELNGILERAPGLGPRGLRGPGGRGRPRAPAARPKPQRDVVPDLHFAVGERLYSPRELEENV